MAGNTLGKYFTVTLYGESHGKCVGVILDGVPAGLDLDEEMIQGELNLRRPGQSDLATPRAEKDQVQVRAGTFESKTTGAPLVMEIKNRDVDSSKYYELRPTPRPSHADLSAYYRFGGFHDFRGGGRFSGRLTAGIVMAGAVARQVLATRGVHVGAYTRSIGPIVDEAPYSIEEINQTKEQSPTRAVSLTLAEKMEAVIREAKKNQDSVGGVVQCRVEGLPAGVGEPFFDTMESVLAHGLFAIPAVKGVEFGSGFHAAQMQGSQHNDALRLGANGKVQFETNHAGGILGGITTGAPLWFNVAFKPTPSIGQPQRTVNLQTRENAEIAIKGRHDPCIVPRAVIVVESLTCLVLVDALVARGLIPPVLPV